MRKAIDLLGKTFGSWAVVGSGGRTSSGDAKWLCRCDCGVEREATGTQLRRGVSKSCGCRRSDHLPDPTTHGMAGSKVYKVWQAMKTRCNINTCKAYPDYGGRGIGYDPRWEKFPEFLADMGLPPGDGYTLERKDNDAGYSKENCVWATRKAQGRNRRSNVWITCSEGSFILLDFAEKVGRCVKTVQKFHRQGMSGDEMLTKFRKEDDER